MSVPDTIPARLQEAGRARGSAPAYYEKIEGSWKTTSWSDFAAQVRQATRALCSLGFKPGHTVCILGFNRPEWVIMDVAAMTGGGAPAGIYTTCSPPEVAYIVNHSEAQIVLLENEGQWKKVEEKLTDLPHLKHVVMMRPSARIDHPMVMSWEQFLGKAKETPDTTVEERLKGLKPEDLATLIYTSGTTGPPKRSCCRITTSPGPQMLRCRLFRWARMIAVFPTFRSPTSPSRCLPSTRRSPHVAASGMPSRWKN